MSKKKRNDMAKKDFYNSNLKFDLEKILSYDLPVKIVKNFDLDLDYPYILQVQDNDFFYPTKKERNKDYKKLISCFVLTYKVKHNKIPYLVTGADYFINKIMENKFNIICTIQNDFVYLQKY